MRRRNVFVIVLAAIQICIVHYALAQTPQEALEYVGKGVVVKEIGSLYLNDGSWLFSVADFSPLYEKEGLLCEVTETELIDLGSAKAHYRWAEDLTLVGAFSYAGYIVVLYSSKAQIIQYEYNKYVITKDAWVIKWLEVRDGRGALLGSSLQW